MDRGTWQDTVQGVHKELDTISCTHTHIPQILVFDVFSSLFCLGNLAIFLSEAIVHLFHCCIVSSIRIYHNLSSILL